MNEKMKWIAFAIISGAVIIAIHKLMKTGGAVADEAGDALHKFGIGTDEKAKAIKNIDSLKPSFYKSLKGDVHLMKAAKAKELAKTIYDARTMGIYTDDETIIGAFKQLINKAQISFLADTFYNMYKVDLITYFYTPMQNSALVALYDYITKLPKQ